MFTKKNLFVMFFSTFKKHTSMLDTLYILLKGPFYQWPIFSTTSPTFHVPQIPSTMESRNLLNPSYMNGKQVIKSVSSTTSDFVFDYSNEVLDMSYRYWPSQKRRECAIPLQISFLNFFGKYWTSVNRDKNSKWLNWL